MILKNKIKEYSFVVIGILLYSLYASIILVPNNVGSSGILGLSIVANKLFGFKIGIVSFILNIPLLLFGFKIVGKSFIIKTLIVTVTSSFLIDTLPKFIPVFILNDKLTAALFCGVLSAVSMALLFIGKASSGGLDISAKIIKVKLKSVSLSRILLIQDFVVYIIIAFTIGLQYVTYALILSFVRSKTFEAIQNNFSAPKQCIIICKKNSKLISEIKNRIVRGITFWNVKGAYSNEDKLILYMVIQNSEILAVKNIIHEIDKEAFVSISDVESVLGNFEEHSISFL